jgi:hypothetical protein
MAEHASGQTPASFTVMGALKFPVPVAISMQHLDGLVLSAGATAATSRQQEERPWSDVGQRGGEAQPASTASNLDLQIACAQTPHVGKAAAQGFEAPLGLALASIASC